jgi:hypothetical protein
MNSAPHSVKTYILQSHTFDKRERSRTQEAIRNQRSRLITL